MTDDDLQLEVTWNIDDEDIGEIRKLQYYGFTRSGYMGGSGTMMLGPVVLQSNADTTSLPLVSSVHSIARAQEIENPVLHMFVMLSAGDPTMTIRGHWNGTNLAYSFGGDPPIILRTCDFKNEPKDRSSASASLTTTNTERMVALAFDATEDGRDWIAPEYRRPDGSSQVLKGTLAVEFSDLSGTWRFSGDPGEVVRPERTAVWGTLFDPADRGSPAS